MKTDLRLLKNTRNWRKTKRGLITNLYHKMKSRHPIELSLEDLHSFSECPKFERLYFEWVKSGYDKQFKPSIDRINNKIGYTYKNIHWLTWSENRYKQTMERRSRKGKVYQIMGNKVVNIYKSQREAVLATGLSQGNMSMVLNGKKKLCGGYKWSYENPELLKKGE